MKVCHYFTPDVARKGVTWKRINAMAGYLVKCCDTTVVTNVGYDAEQKFERINALKLVALPASSAGFSKCWRGQLQELRPDIVHLHGLWCRNAVTAIFDAKRLGIPYIVSTYGLCMPGASKLPKWQEALALNVVWSYFIRNAAHVFTTYDDERDRLAELGVSPAKMITVHGYLDPGPIAVKQNYERTKLIAALVDFEQREDIDLILQALRVLGNDVAGYRLVLLGSGPVERAAELQAELYKQGVSEAVTVRSTLDGNTNAAELLRSAEMAVVLRADEQMNQLVTLALSCALPLVAVRQVMHGDVEAKHCGIVCDRRPTQIYSALLRMLNLDLNDLSQMGHNGRRLMEDKFSSKASAEMFYKVYQDTLPFVGDGGSLAYSRV